MPDNLGGCVIFFPNDWCICNMYVCRIEHYLYIKIFETYLASEYKELSKNMKQGNFNIGK